MRTAPLSLLVFPLLLTAACSAPGAAAFPNKQGPLLGTNEVPLTTAGVSTSDLFPSMSVRSDESGIHVVAALIYPVGHFLLLGENDSLVATINGVSRPLVLESGEVGAPHYATTFPSDDAATSVQVSFMRTGTELSAPNNIVPIVPGFRVAPSASWSAGAAKPPFGSPYALLVTPAIPVASNVAFRVSGACVPPAFVGTNHAAISDGVSSVSLDIGRLLDPVASNCALSIELRAETKGAWDAAFKTDPAADVFEGAQARTFQTIWNPSSPSAALDAGK